MNYLIFKPIHFLVICVLFLALACSKEAAETRKEAAIEYPDCNSERIENLILNLPEVKEKDELIKTLTKGARGVSMQIDSGISDEGSYWNIKVGYNNQDRWETYFEFNIDRSDCDNIRIYHPISGVRTDLEVWRKEKEQESKCYDYLTEMVRNSNFPFRGISKEKVELMIDSDEIHQIKAKVFFETNGTGTLGWITYNPELRRLDNISLDPETPEKLIFDTSFCSPFETCKQIKLNRTLIKILFDTSKIQPQLKYTYISNGGIIGFYSDGAVRGCARCDPEESNIKQMGMDEPYATYTIETDGLIFIRSNGESDKMLFKEESGFPSWRKFDDSEDSLQNN